MKLLSNKRYQDLIRKEKNQELNKTILFELSSILSVSHKIFGNNINNLEDFKDKLNETSSLISEVLKYDVCLFGYKEGTELFDLDLYYKGRVVNNENLNRLKRVEISHSFVGNVINQQNDIYIFESTKDSKITDYSFFKNYHELTISKEQHSNLLSFFSFLKEPINNLIICPITPEELNFSSSVGYLILANKKDFSFGLEKIKIEILKSYLYQIFKHQARSINRSKDHEFISDIYSRHFVYGINEILKYFVNEFQFYYSSFWVPTKEENETAFGLKDCFISEYDKESKRLCLSNDFYLAKEIILGKIINNEISPNFLKKYYLFDEDDYSELNFKLSKTILKGKQLIVIPIKKYLHSTEDEETNMHLGYFCLYNDYRKRDQFKSDFSNRLNNFIEQISFYIEHILYDISFHITNLIKGKIFNLNVSDAKAYYKSLAININEIMSSEHTSIYFVNEEHNLYLKATTSEVFWIDEEDESVIKEVKAIELVDKPHISSYTNEKSATYRSFLSKETLMIHDVYSEKVQSDLSFYEKTNGRHKSIIVQPIIVNDKCIGVIKCINKIERKDSFLKIFTINDQKTINIISDFVSNQFMSVKSVENQNLFVQKLAHENKTPVQIIWSSIENIEFKLKKEDHFYNTLVSNFENLAFATSVLNNNYSNLSTYLRSKEDDLKYDFKPFDFKDKIEDITSFLKPLLQKEENKSVSVKHNLNKMPIINVDEVKIYQVIYNLLSNAIRYCDSSSVVETFYIENPVSIEQSEYFEVQFRNYGIGVLKKDSENIFKEYYRSDEAKIKNPNGTGIGLYVAQTIIKGHGGYIKVTNLNKPTIFSIFLPKKIIES